MPETSSHQPLQAQPMRRRLKAERIQSKLLDTERTPHSLKGDDLSARLEGLPGWVVRDGALLMRRYSFPSPRAAGLFTSLLLELAAQISYAPAIDVRGTDVVVKVRTRRQHGLTELDLEVAAFFDNRTLADGRLNGGAAQGGGHG